jgi:hypothetical protein
MKNKLVLTILLISFLQSTAQNEKPDYSYPPLIMGSDWGNLFQRFFKLGDFDSMLKLTSGKTLNQFGPESIKKYYGSMDFGYSLKLKSWSKNNKHYILNYDAMINATHVVVRMELELTSGDTAKIVLPVDYKTQHYFLYK